MWGGRKVLEGEEGMMSVPLTLPPGYATYQGGERPCKSCGENFFVTAENEWRLERHDLHPMRGAYCEKCRDNQQKGKKAKWQKGKKAKRQCDYCGSTEHNRPQCGKLSDDRASGAGPKRKRRRR
jgi:hypothetical protein